MNYLPSLLSLSTLELRITELLDYMDLHALKQLRLVCKETKLWVENRPMTLKRFPVYIEDDRRMREVTNSTVPWNNFCIRLGLLFYEDHNNSPFLFLTRFSSGMKSLRLQFRDGLSCSVFAEAVSFVLSIVGPTLESFHVVGKLSNLETLWENQDQKHDEYFPGNLLIYYVGLKHLNLELRYSNAQTLFAAGEMITNLVKLCPNLISVEIPIGLAFGRNNNRRYLNRTFFDNHACESLINFIRTFQEQATTSAFLIKLLRIDFFSGKRSYEDLEFPLTKSALTELVKLCEPIGCKLYNVPSNSVSSAESLHSLTQTPHEVFCLRKCVSTILSINNMNSEHHRSLFLFPESDLRVEVGIRFRDGNECKTFDLPNTINVLSINFTCYKSESNEEGTDSVYKNLFGVRRLSVSEINITWICDDLFEFRPDHIQLRNCSPNLRKLYVEIEDVIAIDISAFIRGLNSLEDLTLKTTIDDSSLLGTEGDDGENLILLQLKNLIHLRLIDCNMYGVTDASFQNLFRYMKLKTFVFRPNISSIPDTDPVMVTFKDGISSLCSDEGVFRDSIEILDCFIPRDTTSSKITDFLKVFRNLRSSILNKDLEHE